MRSFCLSFCWPSSGDQRPPSNIIRVVHINGHVEFFSLPATAQSVVRKRPCGYGVWTATRLLSTVPIPLRPTDQLQPNDPYFVLPDSVVFHSDTTPACLVTLVRRLKEFADRSRLLDGEPSQSEPILVDYEMGRWTALVVRPNRPPTWRPDLETIEELRSNGMSSVSSSYIR